MRQYYNSTVLSYDWPTFRQSHKPTTPSYTYPSLRPYDNTTILQFYSVLIRLTNSPAIQPTNNSFIYVLTDQAIIRQYYVCVKEMLYCWIAGSFPSRRELYSCSIVVLSDGRGACNMFVGSPDCCSDDGSNLCINGPIKRYYYHCMRYWQWLSTFKLLFQQTYSDKPANCG